MSALCFVCLAADSAIAAANLAVMLAELQSDASLNSINFGRLLLAKELESYEKADLRLSKLVDSRPSKQWTRLHGHLQLRIYMHNIIYSMNYMPSTTGSSS